MNIERTRDILTPDQAAEYLQVNRETIYRYIREGKLAASQLGRAYRIPRRSLDLLLWATRTRKDISLRDYTGAQISEFIQADQLDEESREIAERFIEVANDRSGDQTRQPIPDTATS
ncbi:MAG TPA: helix-turn-helix domain-containing protein [Chloroflexota bacterium]|nr:helix-turn-helix domain-containing protein [Chloroflexota bacterium]